jgi:flagellar basal-body rod protein FlgF
MSDTIAMLEAAMRADADALRMIGQNVANAEVTAYRRQVPVQSTSFATQLDAIASEPAVDRRAGTLKTTGEPLDLALEGNGYFALQAAGGRVYTRRGDFRISADGMLTAASGQPVLGTAGPIHVGTAIPAIDSDGTVRVGQDVIDQLQLTYFGDEGKLRYLGESLYADAGDAAASDNGYAAIRQGFLESSNVTPVTEMVQLMETMRHFETAQRLVRGYDQMMEKAISELGRAR